MSDATRQHDFHLAVYAGSVQGLYTGELVNQLRMLCQLKDYRISIFDSDGQQVNEAIGLDHVDGVVVIKNSITNRLAEEIVNQRQLPIVAIGYDYYPLQIPIISSDQLLGARLAVEEIISKGHEKIIFVGDLSQYDIRKRFEAFCELQEEHDLVTKDEYIYNVQGALISGGKEAAKAFYQKGCDATAAIFGAGLTAIGFLQKLKMLAPETAAELECICFDAFSLNPVIEPKLAAVDPNIHLIASCAIKQIESQCDNNPPQNQLVQPKLIKIKQNPEDSYNEFIANCVDLPEFYNANYMKSVVAMFGEWTDRVVSSNFDEIMCLATIFKKYLSAFSLVSCQSGAGSGCKLKLLKICSEETFDNAKFNKKDLTWSCSEFKLDSNVLGLEHEPKFIMHFLLFAGDKLKGVISTYGENRGAGELSSFFGFTAYLKVIAKLFIGQKIKQKSKPNLTETESNAVVPSASVNWDYKNSITSWSRAALAMLGFESKVEVNIYQHMEISDRMETIDQTKVTHLIAKMLEVGEGFTAKVKFKQKRGEYIEAQLTGALIGDEGGENQFVEFNITLEAANGHD